MVAPAGSRADETRPEPAREVRPGGRGSRENALMHDDGIHDGFDGDAGYISTGILPADIDVRAEISAGYEQFRPLDEGRVADYIPALARAQADAFGVCVAGVNGRIFAVGDADVEFTIQSISKVFVFALVLDILGPEEVRHKLGVNATGLPFDSVMAIELNAERTMNPMVNAGALATTSLVPGATGDEKFAAIVDVLSCFAGRGLDVDEEVFESEVTTNFRNRGIAHLLYGYRRMYCDPDVVTDLYTRQCALRVTARDLAVMGATLADGGVNPLTGVRAVSSECSPARAGGAGHRRALRTIGRLALRRGSPGQERGERRTRHRVPRQGRGRDVLAATRPGRQQRAGPTRHHLLVRAAGPQPLHLRSVCRARGADRGGEEGGLTFLQHK